MRYTIIELNGRYRESGESTRKLFRFDRFYEQVERILRGKAVRRVLVHRREKLGLPVYGAVEEVAAALRRLTESGREVWYYASSYESFDCVLAAACTHRVLHPLGTVSFTGVSLSTVFLRNMLDAHKVGVEVIRRGRYKSGADLFRTEKFDRYTREQYQAIADGAVASLRSRAASLIPDRLLDELLAGRILTAAEAVEQGIVQAARTVDALLNEWKAEKHREKKAGKIRGRFGRGRRVAVLGFEGGIVDGDTRRSSPMGPMVGDRTMVKEIRALRKSRRVKAVVFRINSGGGSATASENILRELVALNEKKPVVVSMGPVAGSGGYWISATGGRVFSCATTITGSIGVITLFFNLAELLRSHGITVDCVRRGDSADLGSALRPLTEAERHRIDGVVGYLYERFLETVAEARKTTPPAVDELGEGRVWLGADAVERGLVDEVGGLHEAIRYAASLLGTERVQVVIKPRVRRSFVTRILEDAKPATGVDVIESLPVAATVPIALARQCMSLHGRSLAVDPVLAGIVAGR